MNLQKVSMYRVKKNVSLSHRTTFRIGGEALYWYEPRSIGELASFLKDLGSTLPFFVIGAGSNLLVREGVIKKVFIHLGQPAFSRIVRRALVVKVGAGTKIGRFISVLSARGYSGYEFLAGIPGTIGGALVMNAGAKMRCGIKCIYREMKDIVLSVDVVDRQGRVFTLRKNELNFSYRQSNLKPYVVTGCRLQLNRAKTESVQKEIRRILGKRILRQDWRHPSAGSFFKNPDAEHPAGFLIDRCALKGARIGGAQISEKHANFIINAGYAQSGDVIRLMEKIKERVYNRFKIELEPEVEIVS